MIAIPKILLTDHGTDFVISFFDKFYNKEGMSEREYAEFCCEILQNIEYGGDTNIEILSSETILGVTSRLELTEELHYTKLPKCELLVDKSEPKKGILMRSFKINGHLHTLLNILVYKDTSSKCTKKEAILVRTDKPSPLGSKVIKLEYEPYTKLGDRTLEIRFELFLVSVLKDLEV